MADIKVSTAAKRLGLSKVSVHKWVKRLTLIEQGLARKESGLVLLTEEALTVIEQAHRDATQSTATSPSQENGNRNAQVNAGLRDVVHEKLLEQITDRFDQEVRFLRQELTRRDETIEQLVMKQSEERQRTDSIIMKLAHDLEGTRKAALAIEAKVNSLAEKKETRVDRVLREQPKPVKPWTPDPVEKDPLAGMTWLERVWVQIAYPERCRRVSG